MQSIFNFFPQGGGRQGLLNDLIEIESPFSEAIHPHPVSDVVVNRHRKWIGFLKDHTNPAPEMDDVHSIGIDVPAIELDFALQASAWNEIVHAIQRPEKSRLSA